MTSSALLHARLLLLRHKLIRDPLVCGAWQNLLLHQLFFPPVWSPLMIFSVEASPITESLELLGSGCIGVEEIDFFGGDEDKTPAKRDGNYESHDGRQKACSDECT
jgi:hypothetical protein